MRSHLFLGILNLNHNNSLGDNNKSWDNNKTNMDKPSNNTVNKLLWEEWVSNNKCSNSSSKDLLLLLSKLFKVWKMLIRKFTMQINNW